MEILIKFKENNRNFHPQHLFNPQTEEHEPACENIDRLQEQIKENIRNSSPIIYWQACEHGLLYGCVICCPPPLPIKKTR